MKVKELIKKLQEFEPELEVMFVNEEYAEHEIISIVDYALEDYETDGKKIIEIK